MVLAATVFTKVHKFTKISNEFLAKLVCHPMTFNKDFHA